MKSVLAIAAHPDDIEFFMAGTLIRLRQAGWQLHYCNLANGCYGSTVHDKETIIRLRRDEARRCAERLGAVYHESVCDDMSIYFEPRLLAKTAAIVRAARPEIVLTHSPADYMEDHTNACRLAVTAAFTRGMPNFATDPPLPPYEGVVTVYHAQPYSHRDPLRRVIEPDLFVDVTDLMEEKEALLLEHKSQFEWLEQSQGHASLTAVARSLDEEAGRMSSMFQFAEGWRRRLHLGYCGPRDDPLRAALKKEHVFVVRE